MPTKSLKARCDTWVARGGLDSMDHLPGCEFEDKDVPPSAGVCRCYVHTVFAAGYVAAMSELKDYVKDENEK